MFINRNNYETFFLLYADDELCAAERIVVENFVTINEDLRGELNMILAAILPADDCSFTQKDLLYKNSFVDGSLQEKLLLKMDDELLAEELSALNNIILANPSATKEEHLLSATKLTTEIISCPQKELLFKKQRDTVVVFKIVRWAAAAILIGVGLFFGASIFNKKALPVNAVVKVKPIIKPALPKEILGNLKEEQAAAVIVTDTGIPANENIKKVQIAAIAKGMALNKKNNIEKAGSENTTVINKKELASNKEVLKTISTSENISIQNINQSQTASLNKPEKVQIAITNENIVPLETSYAQAVSLTDIKTSNNKILYMDEEDVKRSKVGTIFKQLKRMIERTAKIKTANPIRIAGFQIGAD